MRNAKTFIVALALAGTTLAVAGGAAMANEHGRREVSRVSRFEGRREARRDFREARYEYRGEYRIHHNIWIPDQYIWSYGQYILVPGHYDVRF